MKRFDYVNSKWVKTQKVVNFPFKNFDPTAYLASVPQETILRHSQLMQQNCENATDDFDTKKMHSIHHHTTKLVDIDEIDNCNFCAKKEDKIEKPEPKLQRKRLESTSLIKTPIIDGDLRDFHEHKLSKGQDPFDLKYQLYAVVVSNL